MICSESLAQIQKIQKNSPSPVHGYVMPNNDYASLLKEAMKNSENQYQLEQCLQDSQSAVDSDDALEWGAAGFALGFLSTAALVYILK